MYRFQITSRSRRKGVDDDLEIGFTFVMLKTLGLFVKEHQTEELGNVGENVVGVGGIQWRLSAYHSKIALTLGSDAK